MYDMIGHIFGGLDGHERRLNDIEAALKKKPIGLVGKLLIGGVVLGVGYLLYQQNERIEKLETQVQEQKDILDSACSVEEVIEEDE